MQVEDVWLLKSDLKGAAFDAGVNWVRAGLSSYELQVTSYKLQVKSYKLQVTS